MTRNEAIKIIKECKEKGFKHTLYTFNEYDAALDMAIKALEQEPCEDAISRQAALGCCRNEWEEEVEMRLKSLPSVTSQQKYGDIAKAFQLGLAFWFGKKYNEMDKVIDEIKKVITFQSKQGGEQE